MRTRELKFKLAWTHLSMSLGLSSPWRCSMSVLTDHDVPAIQVCHRQDWHLCCLMSSALASVILPWNQVSHNCTSHNSSIFHLYNYTSRIYNTLYHLLLHCSSFSTSCAILKDKRTPAFHGHEQCLSSQCQRNILNLELCQRQRTEWNETS